MKENGDLNIIMKAKDLCSYVTIATQKSPKQFRFTFTTRLQNLIMDIISHLYIANDIYVGNMNELGAKERVKERLDMQRKILTEIRLLSYMAQLSLENKAITKKQYEQISKYTTELIKLSMAWIHGDKRRLQL